MQTTVSLPVANATNWKMWLSLSAVLLVSIVLHGFQLTATVIPEPLRADARIYANYAINLKDHDIFSGASPQQTIPPVADALVAPGYPIFMASFIDERQEDLGLSKLLIAQALLGVAVVALSFWLFVMIMPLPYAVGAALLTATSPHLINISSYFLTESLFTFLLLAHITMLVAAYQRRSIYWLIASAILLAASAAVRPTSQYLILVYALAVPLLRVFPMRSRLKVLVILAMPVLAFMISWGLRNQVVIGKFSDPTLQASFLQHGMYINMMYDNIPQTYGYPYRFDPQSAAFRGQTSKVVAAILERVKAQPLRYTSWYLVGKPLQFLSWDLTESIGGPFIYAPAKSPWLDNPIQRTLGALMQMLHAPFMLAALVAVFVIIRRIMMDKSQLVAAAPVFLVFPLALICSYFIVFHMIGAPFPRYSIPLRPVSYGLAIWFVWQAINWLDRRQAT